MLRRVGLSIPAALLVIGTQAGAALGAANTDASNCLALFVTGQPPGDVSQSILNNLDEAHPIGLNVISFTAQVQPPCFEE